MKKYDAKKISFEFTNLDFLCQLYPTAIMESVGVYDLNNGYRIIWTENDSNIEEFIVEHTYFDRDVGVVTDDELFTGDVGQCLKFIQKREGVK